MVPEPSGLSRCADQRAKVPDGRLHKVPARLPTSSLSFPGRVWSFWRTDVLTNHIFLRNEGRRGQVHMVPDLMQCTAGRCLHARGFSVHLQIKHFIFLKSEPFAAIMTNNSWMRCHTVHSAAIISLNHSQTHFTRGVTVIICTVLQLSCLFLPSVKRVGVVKLEMCVGSVRAC